MIDFRYHLVSLISVFLALAVGIILGAGPLQGALGDQLTDQVETLRTERNELRDSLDVSERTAGDQLRFIEAAGPSLVQGSLEGLRVALVELDDAAGDHRQGAADAVESAGGTVVAVASLQPAWTSADHAGLRDTLAHGLRARVGGIAQDQADDAATDEVIGAALGVALSGQVTSAVRSEEATAIEQQLVQAGLIAVDGEQGEPADIVVILSGRLPDPDEGQDEDGNGNVSPAPEPDPVAAFVTLARAMQDVVATVVVGPTVAPGDVVSAVRGETATARVVSTVSGVETQVGRIVVPLAAAAQWVGEVGQYGFEDGAAVLPPDVRGLWSLEDLDAGEPDAEEPDGGEQDGGDAPAEGGEPGDGDANGVGGTDGGESPEGDANGEDGEGQ